MSQPSQNPKKSPSYFTGVCLACQKPFTRELKMGRTEYKTCSTTCSNEYKRQRLAKFNTENNSKYRESRQLPESVPNAELARRTLARRRMMYFTKQTLPGYQAGWVHEDICRRLEKFSREVAEKKSPRLMLLVPPRHGKSELASIRFPAWHLGHHPQHEIINVSYNLDLPMKFSRKVRELLRDPFYAAIFPDTVLNPDSQSIETWATLKGGGFLAAGVGGGITGKGAHVLIVDDPIKNQQEADSVLVRDQLWEWYQSTAYTRLAPGGGVLVIETWWHDDDLAGRIQQLAAQDPRADQFEIVKYPAIAEQLEIRDRETLHVTKIDCGSADEGEVTLKLAASGFDETKQEVLRRPGEALHPDRYPIDALERIKATLSKRIWSALFQQNPVPDEGAYFLKEQFKYEDTAPPPLGRLLYSAWDFAITEKQTADYTVGITVLQDENDVLHVVDMVRFRESDAHIMVENILDMAARWNSHGVPYVIGFEDGQIWRAIEATLKRRMQERNIWPATELLKPFTDKLARARPLQARMQHDRVRFLNNTSWTTTLVNEMLRFPAGVHDDCVDALAWAAQLAVLHQPPTVAPPPKLASWKDKLESLMMGLGAGSHMSA